MEGEEKGPTEVEEEKEASVPMVEKLVRRRRIHGQAMPSMLGSGVAS